MMSQVVSFAFVVVFTAVVLAVPAATVFTPWHRVLIATRRSLQLPTAVVLAILVCAVITGLAALAMVEAPWLLKGWSRPDRLQASQAMLTYVGFVVATVAFLLAFREFRASRAKPSLAVEWRSPLLVQNREWTGSGAVVPSLQSSRAVIEIRVMNYGTRAASFPLVEFVAQGDDLSLKQFTLTRPDFVQDLPVERWREDLQFGTQGTHVGHFRPDTLIYPQTVEPYAYELHLGPARRSLVETDEDGTVRTSWSLAFPDERLVRVRVMCAEQPAREQLIRLDLAAARRLYEDR